MDGWARDRRQEDELVWPKRKKMPHEGSNSGDSDEGKDLRGSEVCRAAH